MKGEVRVVFGARRLARAHSQYCAAQMRLRCEQCERMRGCPFGVVSREESNFVPSVSQPVLCTYTHWRSVTGATVPIARSKSLSAAPIVSSPTNGGSARAYPPHHGAAALRRRSAHAVHAPSESDTARTASESEITPLCPARATRTTALNGSCAMKRSLSALGMS